MAIVANGKPCRNERNKISEATHPETSACGISSAAAHFADGPSSAASSAAAAASALTAGLASCGHKLPWCAASLTDVWSVHVCTLRICAKLADFSSQLIYQGASKWTAKMTVETGRLEIGARHTLWAAPDRSTNPAL